MNNLLEMLKKNVGLLIVAIIMIAVMYSLAYFSERIIEKKQNVNFRASNKKTQKLAMIAMLSAIALVLMYFDFPLPFIAPGFYKLDFSEIPVLVGTFMLGPCAGVFIEAVKVILHICLKGTTTAFVGDFANFILGCAFVVPASIIFHTKRNKTRMIIGIITGAVILIISGMALNALYLLPTYSILYGMPMEKLIAAGTAVNSNINNVFTFVAFAVMPFNLIKAIISGTVTALLYSLIKILSKNYDFLS